MNKNSLYHRFRRLCAILIGIVFLLSGIFKLMDPVGAGLVVEEYFRFLKLPFLLPSAKVVAVSMALLEALVGAALISGIRRKLTAIVTSLLLLFFTVLTILLAIFNPTMDCGCFGEVVHLTNIQTLLKNVVLDVLALIAFITFGSLGTNKRRKDVAFVIVALSLAAFTAYSLVNLPLMDFTAFSAGSELVAAKGAGENDADASEEYESTFIYEKDGQEGVFTLDNLPDSTWTFVRTETIQMKRFEVDDKSPVLSFSDSTGNYRDELAASGNVLAFSVYDPSKVQGESWTKMGEVLEGARTAGFTPLLLVASTAESMDTLSTILPEVRKNLLGMTYYADRKTLVSMNRSNGGATWFNDGQLIRKYRLASLPSNEDLLAMTGEDSTEAMLKSNTRGRLRFEGFVLYSLAILLIL